MPLETIALISPMANCYLLKSDLGFCLIDTGSSWQRLSLSRQLIKVGCRPGQLRLVVVTHADFDHTGNCPWLRRKYGCPVAIHAAESPALEQARMSLSRKTMASRIYRFAVDTFGRIVGRPFKPDILLDDGASLLPYGFDAKIVHVPGHTTGSIGVLTVDGGFFCGDLLRNTRRRPEKNPLMDNAGELEASVIKLGSLPVKRIYPGHGRPFTMAELLAIKPSVI